MGPVKTPSVSELIAEGLSEGGFRAEHALAMAMADVSPEMLEVLRETRTLLESLPISHDTMAAITRINGVLTKATIPAVAKAS